MMINKDNQMTLPELAEFNKYILHSSCLLELKDICNISELTEDNAITLKESENNKIFPRHFLRYFEV